MRKVVIRLGKSQKLIGVFVTRWSSPPTPRARAIRAGPSAAPGAGSESEPPLQPMPLLHEPANGRGPLERAPALRRL